MPAPLLILLPTLLISLAHTAQQESSIVNGREAKPHSRPYMVSVQRNNKHICGGFLVSKSVVMTAAHCLTWGESLTVLLGAHNISASRKSVRVGVKLYHIHPGYNVDTLDGDVMLLQLSNAVQKSKTVGWIPLPKQNKDVKPKTVCSVSGWGATVTKGLASQRLMEADVTVVDHTGCKKSWEGKLITPRMMCAGGSVNNKGFCQGDSGGPLVCKGAAVGIVSFNEYENCNMPKKPNVYSQISKYMSWISCIIKSIN